MQINKVYKVCLEHLESSNQKPVVKGNISFILFVSYPCNYWFYKVIKYVTLRFQAVEQKSMIILPISFFKTEANMYVNLYEKGYIKI